MAGLDAQADQTGDLESTDRGLAVYDGFISYSHRQDRPIAISLQSTLQKLGKPWYRRRALRIFRDDASLSALPSLWPAIERALEQSRYLILLASPEAAASTWVNKEVAFWIKHKKVEHLLIGITGGDLCWDDAARDFNWHETTALPPSLRGQFGDDPRWIDLRKYRKGASARHPGFVEACADFSATIQGIPKEDLLSEEVRQQRRALLLAWSAVCMLLVLAASLAWKWNEALNAERLAVMQRDRAEKTLAATTGMTNDLIMNVAVKIRNRLGIPVDLVRDILTRSRDLLDKLLEPGELSPDLRRGIAIALRELATTSLIQGDVSTALEAAERSRDIMLGLVSGDRDNPQWLRELSLSYNRVGEALSRAGRRADALNTFELALALRKRLAEREQGSPEAQRDLAVSYERVGSELFAAGKTDEATDAYRSAMEIQQKLLAEPAPNDEWSRDLSVSYEKMGDVSTSLDDLDAALEHYAKSLEIRQSLAAADPNNAEARRDVAISFAKIADVRMKTGEQDMAVAAYKKSLDIRDQLVAADPGNSGWQADLIVILIKLGDSGDEPKQRYSRAMEIARRLDAEGKLAGEQKTWIAELARRLLQP